MPHNVIQETIEIAIGKLNLKAPTVSDIKDMDT